MHYPLGIIIKDEIGIEKRDAIRSAEYILEDYYNIAYDWYNAEPDVVRFYNVSQNDFWDSVNLLITRQKEEVGYLQTQLQSIDKYIEEYESGEPEQSALGSYYLYKFGKFMNGSLQCDSYIYDGEKCSARITKNDLESYRNPPEGEQYYLVVLDIHF